MVNIGAVIVLDSISCPSLYRVTKSCQVIFAGLPTLSHVTKKLALNPYLSKIGFALVNWLFHPSPKVKIATLGAFVTLSYVLLYLKNLSDP
jgi:hypothetical protein